VNAYDQGQSVRLSVTFTNPDGTAYDPVVVQFIYHAPLSVVALTKTYGTDAEVIKDGVGLYHMDLIADEPGEWHYRAEGSGNGQAVEEDSFYVEATEV
jgi:hypothetical protein